MLSPLPLVASRLAIFAIFASTPASHADGLRGAVALSSSPARLAGAATALRLERASDWQSFKSRHGAWRAVWNEATGTPHRAFGPPIALSGTARDSAEVDGALRAFLHGERALFGPSLTVRTVAIQKVRDLWYARYQQTFRGIPLAFSDLEFRVNEGGGLLAFGADVHAVPPSTSTTPLIVPAAAREAARAGLAFDPTRDQIEGDDRLWLVPTPGDGGTLYRLAHEVEIRTANPPALWLTLVDATNGEVLWRHNRVRTVVSGTVTGQVHLNLPTDPLDTRPFAHENVSVDGGIVTTDLAGAYSGAASGSARVMSSLSGPFCVVDRPGNSDADFNVTVQDPATVPIAWAPSNSADSERDGWFHVNLAHDYVKGLDPGFTLNDYAMPCRVEQAGDVCNAFWDGAGVNFYAAGGGCPSMATLPDVIDHEYGHSVNDHVYRQAGVGFGMLNDALHEGMADVFSALLTDDPAIGSGVMGPGTSWRTLANGWRWPEDASGDPHDTGLIIGGAFWDLRQSLGLPLATQLSHFSKYGTADDPDDGIAMSEYFLETLIADDDDGNLANGTPHFSQINAAFDAHGIGTGFFLSIDHSPLADQPTSGPYVVSAHIEYSGPFGALDPGSPMLHYSVDGAPFTALAMTASGLPGDYVVSLPAPMGSLVRYWVSAADVSGGSRTAPLGAPARNGHSFLTGAVTTLLLHDHESDSGWTVGGPGDAATTGLWARLDPVGTAVDGIPVQPELDHTPDPGVACFVTGNAAPSDPVGTADVDGGATSLLTPVFSAAGVSGAVIEYWRWYSNNGGADPGTDVWRVDLSNDGGASWTAVESTIFTDASWRRVLVRIADYLPPTSTMRVRFVASDVGLSSLVEAAVDDFRLLSLPVTTGVEPGTMSATLALSPGQPNPFRDVVTLRYTLPAGGHVALDIHDLAGRVMRRVARGTEFAGEHAALWDGRDEAGHPVASGAYYARLTLDGQSVVRRLVRVH